MREEQVARAGGGVRLERLLGAQVAARLAVGLAALERRLADEEVGVARELGDPLARPRVARVRERHASVRHPEAVGLEAVVRQPHGKDLEARRRERRVGVVLRHGERALEHVGEPEARAELLEERAPAPVHPERRAHVVVAPPVEAAPDPRDEIAPVVEVKVRDRDRVDGRPRLAFAQPTEHAGAAVEEEALAFRLDDVAGVRAARVRPGRGRPDDDEAHVPILTAWSGRFGS